MQKHSVAAMITAKSVSVRYMVGDFKEIGIKEYIIRKIMRKYTVMEFWAVKNVSFSVNRGDMLGIIGTNGAGKSTLLKAVSGIMIPTKGCVSCNGRIAALLELGSGFDGDLTVKENTYLRGALLGYTKSFMDEAYRDIIDFAELGDFEDRHFKQLSSGMKSRLAFSIAARVNPDILILDDSASALDFATDAALRSALKTVGQDCVTFIVSQRTSSLAHADLILVLDDGEVVGMGNHHDLLESCEVYREIYDSQFKQEKGGKGNA
jgi:ABC-2 type transport system ATP-binding protein